MQSIMLYNVEPKLKRPILNKTNHHNKVQYSFEYFSRFYKDKFQSLIKLF